MNNTQDETSRLAIWGPSCPPYGGVSVHIFRLLEILRSNGIQTTLYEENGKGDPSQGIVPVKKSAIAFGRTLLTFPEDVMHFHLSNHTASILASLCLSLRPKKRYLFTLHGDSVIEFHRKANAIMRRLLGSGFRRADQIICVNDRIQEFLTREIGVESSRTAVIPAYLPPSAAELASSNIPQEVSAFVNCFDQVIGSHGWYGFFDSGNHVYGFEHLVKLAEDLKDKRPSACLYTMVSGTYDPQHREEISAIRNEKQLDNWLLIEDAFPAAAIFKQTDVFLRPTSTDGDSVSIRECIDLGVRVVASDAVSRPASCVVFQTHDYTQMRDCVFSALDESQSNRVLPKTRSNVMSIINVLRSVLRRDI